MERIPPRMNLRVLRPSRRKLHVGDIFALQAVPGEFMYGRVIRVEERGGPMDGFNLIYLYGARSSEKEDVPALRSHDLLCPPVHINRLGWSHGVFETVCSRALSESDVLPVHCFEDPVRGVYLDEYGNPLPAPSEPCGIYALYGYGYVNRVVSEALGLSLEPDE